MGQINRETFVKLLDKNLTDVSAESSKFMEMKSMISVLFREISSNRPYEEFFTYGGVPDIPAFNGHLTTLNMHPGYSSKVEPKEYAGQLQYGRKLLDDQSFLTLQDGSRGLMESAWRVADKKAVSIFANASSTAFDYLTSEEGVALASSSHTTRYPGVSTTDGFSNSGSTPLSKTAVAATKILMHKFKQSNGERYETGDEYSLIVPDALADTAYEIFNTSKEVDSANNNANPYYKRYNIIPYMRLDDYTTTSWGLVDTKRMKQDLLWIWRIKPEAKREIDWSTYATMQAVYTRFGCGFKDWRWLYWHTV